MKDIFPQSERIKKREIKKESIDSIDYGFDVVLANEIGLEIYEIDFNDNPLFPDRFTPKHTKKLTLVRKLDSIEFNQWSYKDSIQTMNAFYNWIDCFGPNCKSIKLGQEVKFQKDNFIVLISDTSITYISSSIKLKSEDWMGYYEKKNEITNWKILIQQKTGGKAHWNCVVDGEIKELNLLK